MTKIIGITGVIGSGKTLVSSYLKAKTYKVFDADEEVGKLYREKEFLSAISRLFPEVFIDGKLNKRLLAHIVFDDNKKRQKLEALIHPIVNKACDEFIASNQDEAIIFLDIPLLFEVKWDKKCDYTMVISIRPKIQMERFLARGGTNKELQKRTQSQIDNDQKVAKADFVVDNNGTKADTYKQIERIIAELNAKK